MTVMDWPSNVNNRLNLEGGYGQEEGFIKTVEFESGKKRVYLKNSYVPLIYPSLSLPLDNTTPAAGGSTEFEEFRRWYEISLRYGTLPFYLPRIGYRKSRKRWYIKTGEVGIYRFVPESLSFDKMDGVAVASFGLEEIGVLSEVEHVFLATNIGEILLSSDGKYIVV